MSSSDADRAGVADVRTRTTIAALFSGVERVARSGADRRSAIVGVALATLVVGWAWYVFGSSQAGYALACVGIAVALGMLAFERARVAAVLVVAVTVLIGTEIRGDLAAGRPLLGSLRLLDTGLLFAVAGIAAAAWPVDREGMARRLRGLAASPVAHLVAVGCAWAGALWLLNGAPRDAVTRADLRLVAIGVAAWIVFSRCVALPPRGWALAWAAIAITTSAKAVAIYLSEVWVIGTQDRLQASSVEAGDHLRVILVGGDTLLVLAPAILLFAARYAADRRVRGLLIGALSAALVALLLSGTRTGLLVSIGVLIAANLGMVRSLRQLGRRRVAVIVALAGIAFAPAAVATGVVERFVTPDAPATGLNFRRDELDALFDLPPADLVFGQGIGGRFVGKGSRGEPVNTGWAHAWPAWVVLKVGLVGLACLLAVGAFGLCRHVRRRSTLGRAARRFADIGAIAVGGLLVMSLTLGRVMLPEGIILLMFGIAAMSARQGPARRGRPR